MTAAGNPLAPRAAPVRQRVWWRNIGRATTFMPREVGAWGLSATRRVWEWHHWFQQQIVSKV